MPTFSISGNIVDVLHKTIFPGTVTVKNGRIHSIEHQQGQQYSQYIQPGFIDAHIHNDEVTADIKHDILKIAVVNRYQDQPPAIALIKNFRLQRGAIASSVAHDSHNIVAVGTTDAEICLAVNAIIQAQGGIAVAEGNTVKILPLPVAGLMSTADGYTVAKQYAELDTWVKHLGSTLSAPFMTLAFMALLVIPDLKLSDQGLFSSKDFQFVSLWIK